MTDPVQAPGRRRDRLWTKFSWFVIGLVVVTVLFGIVARAGAMTGDYWLLLWLAIVLGWLIALLAAVAFLLAAAVSRLAQRT